MIEIDSLLRAMAIIDLLEAGWRPGEKELADARCVAKWGLLPCAKRRPYRIMGLVWSLSEQSTPFVAPIIAIDQEARWARIWDEWIVIGDPLSGTPPFNAAEIQRTGAAWLTDEMRRLHVMT